MPDNWSGRYWQNGGGGFNGTIPSAVSTSASGVITALNPALAQKAAVYAASNGGNRASVPAEAAPAVWANGTANGAASTIQVWFDGVQRYSSTSVNMLGSSLSKVQLGAEHDRQKGDEYIDHLIIKRS